MYLFAFREICVYFPNTLTAIGTTLGIMSCMV